MARPGDGMGEYPCGDPPADTGRITDEIEKYLIPNGWYNAVPDEIVKKINVVSVFNW